MPEMVRVPAPARELELAVSPVWMPELESAVVWVQTRKKVRERLPAEVLKQVTGQRAQGSAPAQQQDWHSLSSAKGRAPISRAWL